MKDPVAHFKAVLEQCPEDELAMFSLGKACYEAGDYAPLNGMVESLFAAGIEVHCLRDLTRGGLATTLVEIAESSGCRLCIDSRAVPVEEQVRGACEMLGLDPLYVANEGRFAVFVPMRDADRAVKIIQAHAPGAKAAAIGSVDTEQDGMVTLISPIGTRRIIDHLSGEQLPGIC